MIRTPTLFVLGAGASQPYGLPLGTELRALICNAENDNDEAARIVVEQTHFSRDEIRGVAKAFQRSQVKSIDAFLARYDHLMPVGKALIAANICLREKPARIRTEANTENWYRLLWNVLIDDASRDRGLRQNAVRFLTFNYDRSLEFFLHDATRHTFGLNDAGAFDEWSKLQILHVYGSVGHFNFSDGANVSRTRPYTNVLNPGELDAAAAGINIIPEGRDDSKAFLTARKWFDWSEQVYVLGFGFDSLNCSRLGFELVAEFMREHKRKIPTIHASVLGLTGPEAVRARIRLIGGSRVWTEYKENNFMTLRSSGFPG